MTLAATPAMPTHELLGLLRAHFIKPDDYRAGAVCLTEVTAPGSTRRADLVHVGLWASRGGGSVDVCELKTSRADFRRELESPAKAEAWWPYSSRFWIVSPGEHITPAAELPAGWGLMVPGKARRFRVVTKPAEREPKLSIPLLVTLLTSTETVRMNALEEQRRRLAEEHRREVQEQRMKVAAAADPQTRRRLDLLAELEASLGMKLDKYGYGDGITPADAGQALKSLARGHAAVGEMQRDLAYRARGLESLGRALYRQADELRKGISADTTVPAAQEA